MPDIVPSTPKPPPSHVWSLILPHLRNPLPEPRCKPARSALRQNALCSASRVSKLFHEICQPILYHTVVTDDLPLLLSQTELLSVRANFAYTRHLFIEYSDKTSHTKYSDLVRHGREKWEAIGLTPRAAKLQYLAAVKEEVGTLTACFKKVNKLWNGKAILCVFPQLESIAVGAILGTSYDDMFEEPGDPALHSECIDHFDVFIESGDIKHFCIRDVVAPISLATFSFASTYPKARAQKHYTRTVHIPYIPKRLPIPLGLEVRYVADSSPSLDHTPTLLAVEDVMRRTSRYRKELLAKGYGNARDTVDIDIYSSASCIRAPPLAAGGGVVDLSDPSYPLRTMDVAEQASLGDTMGKVVQEQFRRDSGLQDAVRWRRADEMGICGACGSGPPT